MVNQLVIISLIIILVYFYYYQQKQVKEAKKQLKEVREELSDLKFETRLDETIINELSEKLSSKGMVSKGTQTPSARFIDNPPIKKLSEDIKKYYLDIEEIVELLKDREKLEQERTELAKNKEKLKDEVKSVLLNLNDLINEVKEEKQTLRVYRLGKKSLINLTLEEVKEHVDNYGIDLSIIEVEKKLKFLENEYDFFFKQYSKISRF